MRDYLYIWRDKDREVIVASGLEFSDLQPYFKGTNSGVILLKHGYEDACYCPNGIEFVPANEIAKLAGDDIYNYGDFVWLDFPGAANGGVVLPPIPDRELAEMLFFAHQRRPLDGVSLESIGNQHLAVAHDDGWSLHLYSSSWRASELFLRSSLKQKLSSELLEAIIVMVESGESAYLILNGELREIECTEDIDSILQQHIKLE